MLTPHTADLFVVIIILGTLVAKPQRRGVSWEKVAGPSQRSRPLFGAELGVSVLT